MNLWCYGKTHVHINKKKESRIMKTSDFLSCIDGEQFFTHKYIFGDGVALKMYVGTLNAYFKARFNLGHICRYRKSVFHSLKSLSNAFLMHEIKY